MTSYKFLITPNATECPITPHSTEDEIGEMGQVFSAALAGDPHEADHVPHPDGDRTLTIERRVWCHALEPGSSVLMMVLVCEVSS